MFATLPLGMAMAQTRQLEYDCPIAKPDEERIVNGKIPYADIVIRKSVYTDYQGFLSAMGNAPKVSISAPLLNAGLNLGITYQQR